MIIGNFFLDMQKDSVMLDKAGGFDNNFPRRLSTGNFIFL